MLTGSQVFAKELKSLGIHYVAGIPSSGSWSLVEALRTPGADIPFIQVMQEQSAVHMADGYFRACGRPMAALLPTPLRRTKALGAIATALADRSAMLVIGGEQAPGLPGVFEPPVMPQNASPSQLKVGKARLSVTGIEKLPAILRKAFETMVSGDAGPVTLDISLDVQGQSIDIKGARSTHRIATGIAKRPDPQVLQQISEHLRNAQRPVLLGGGGVIAHEVTGQLLELAEAFHLPVVTTAQGKGAFPEDHPLSMGTLGLAPDDPVDLLVSRADVVIAIGCALNGASRQASPDSGARPGVSQTLITVDDEKRPHPGSQYVQITLTGDLESSLSGLCATIDAPQRKALRGLRAPLRKSLTALRKARDQSLTAIVSSDAAPLSAQRPLHELRVVLERDAILVVGAGSLQAAVRQAFPVYLPRSHLCAGGAGEVGWAVPAAIGAKLAMPARQVVCVVGDGDFLQSMQEMAVCVMHTIPVVFAVFNNSGYASLSRLHAERNANHLGGEFNLPDGKPYSPDFAVIARSFGLDAWRVEHGSQLNAVLTKAINSKGPSLVEVITARIRPAPQA